MIRKFVNQKIVILDVYFNMGSNKNKIKAETKSERSESCRVYDVRLNRKPPKQITNKLQEKTNIKVKISPIEMVHRRWFTCSNGSPRSFTMIEHTCLEKKNS